MARVQADDTDAFDALYDRHAERAFRVARAICRDLDRAEDSVEEGFLAIWRDRANYRPELGSFQAWAMRIVQNRAIDSSRKAAGRPPPQMRDEDGYRFQADTDSTSPHDDAIACDEHEALLSSLRLLPDAQAEVIVLAFFGDLSHTEIARQLDLPPGTVKGRMRLGLQKLRDQMGVAPASR